MKLIYLTQGQVAKVDDGDFDRLGHLRWFAHFFKSMNSFYAGRQITLNGKQKTIHLHREVMGNPVGMKVDHKNHDTLDCRRENLRICTTSQNGMNRKGPDCDSRSGVRGVCWDKSRGKWISQIRINNKSIRLGRFSDKADAILERANAERKYFGEFAGAH